MEWIPVSTEEELEIIDSKSHLQPVVIFKHSVTCSISKMAKQRLEREQPPTGVLFYYLDLLRYRSVSNKVALHYSVHHESPQVLLIKDDECVYDESHNGISMWEITEQADAVMKA